MPGTNIDAMMNDSHYMDLNVTPCIELERNKIKYIKLLGSGNFGEVYKAIFDDTAVAVKSLKGEIFLEVHCNIIKVFWTQTGAQIKRQSVPIVEEMQIYFFSFFS